MPDRALIWHVGCVTMMNRAGHSFHGKYARVLIITALKELSFSCRSKMAGYAAIAFSCRCLLRFSEKVVAGCCVRRGRGEISGSSLVCHVLGPLVGGGLVGTSWGGTLPVLTCSQRLASSSHVVAAGTCGGCGAVSVVPVLSAARSCRLSMRF